MGSEMDRDTAVEEALLAVGPGMLRETKRPALRLLWQRAQEAEREACGSNDEFCAVCLVCHWNSYSTDRAIVEASATHHAQEKPHGRHLHMFHKRWLRSFESVEGQEG